MINIFRLFGAAVATNFVARILVALGVSFVSYTGFSTILNSAANQLRSLFGGMPSDIIAYIGLSDIDLAINMVLSAYTAKLAMVAMKTLRFE
ncbi:DUF2523 domain-containing protein [Rheinheimera riviphila]|uniref:DUF2523 domain-containing protein n=1 Tax=Rheinheimera riviphila TaxID=1834037 RepID=A0A437QFK5_9GAMM|nr:DUF2523 domain-containing protein [Rheinheimera riviphila]RVU33236.1 DUF2523 domain-containing protein [Rheinheimera riviphila]